MNLLAALDLKLRQNMQYELIRLKESGELLLYTSPMTTMVSDMVRASSWSWVDVYKSNSQFFLQTDELILHVLTQF